MGVNGRWCRMYLAGPRGTGRFEMPVTYHRRGRQLTVSPKLLARVLRPNVADSTTHPASAPR